VSVLPLKEKEIMRDLGSLLFFLQVTIPWISSPAIKPIKS